MTDPSRRQFQHDLDWWGRESAPFHTARPLVSEWID